jgi:RNA polymerase sigma-54 factor
MGPSALGQRGFKEMVMELTLAPEMRPVASPALLAYAGMLTLSSAELEAVVAQELLANPALERADTPGCPLCGSAGYSCRCATGRVPPAVAGSPGPAGWAAPRTGAEELLEEVRWSLTARETALADYLIGCLDDRGFLRGGPEQVAHDVGVGVAEVNRVLDSIRRVGPPAVGARDVRESLLLQLAAMNSADPRCEVAQAIARRHLEPLARGRLDAIAAELGCSQEEIAIAVLYIRRHCTPSPAPGLRGSTVTARVPAVPDVVITHDPRREGELRVEMIEPARLALRINPGYTRLAVRGRDPGVREHAGSLVRQAASFISRLDERFGTIRQVVEYAAGRQRAFVLRGPRYLQPLAQADVARELGIHESTVSRAVAGKYMMLPSRAVVPVQDFFRSALAPQDALRRLIAAEKQPLSDTELAQLLQAQGFRVARRTVAKYRHALGLAAAPLRAPALAGRSLRS